MLTEVVDVLQTVYDATIAIQNPAFTLSDFYCCWIRIQMRLQRMNSNSSKVTDLADILLEDLKNRKNALLEHPAMLCAIFLDPRVHRELESDAVEYKIAKMTLADLNERIFKSKGEPSKDNDPNANDSLEEYFNQQVELENDAEQYRRTQFVESLDHFHRCVQIMKFEPIQTISEFWEKNKLLFPALYDVACVINAIPPTQATVERAFSTLKFVFGELRTMLDQGRLEDILMIKLNADMADIINQSDIDKIKKKNTIQTDSKQDELNN